MVKVLPCKTVFPYLQHSPLQRRRKHSLQYLRAEGRELTIYLNESETQACVHLTPVLAMGSGPSASAARGKDCRDMVKIHTQERFAVSSFSSHLLHREAGAGRGVHSCMHARRTVSPAQTVSFPTGCLGCSMLQSGNETAPINTVTRKPRLISGRFDFTTWR